MASALALLTCLPAALAGPLHLRQLGPSGHCVDNGCSLQFGGLGGCVDSSNELNLASLSHIYDMTVTSLKGICGTTDPGKEDCCHCFKLHANGTSSSGPSEETSTASGPNEESTTSKPTPEQGSSTTSDESGSTTAPQSEPEGCYEQHIHTRLGDNTLAFLAEAAQGQRTFLECQELCTARQDCAGFTSTKIGNCYLKAESQIVPISSVNATSAVKVPCPHGETTQPAEDTTTNQEETTGTDEETTSPGEFVCHEWTGTDMMAFDYLQGGQRREAEREQCESHTGSWYTYGEFTLPGCGDCWCCSHPGESTTAGTDGPTGESTTAGTDGPTGESTTAGTDGPTGESTTAGTDGPTGESTTAGTDGPTGESTTAGTDGPSGESTSYSTAGSSLPTAANLISNGPEDQTSTTAGTDGPTAETTNPVTDVPVEETTTGPAAPEVESQCLDEGCSAEHDGMGECVDFSKDVDFVGLAGEYDLAAGHLNGKCGNTKAELCDCCKCMKALVRHTTTTTTTTTTDYPWYHYKGWGRRLGAV